MATHVWIGEMRSTKSKAGLPNYQRGWAKIVRTYGTGPDGIGGHEFYVLQWPNGATADWPADDGVANINRRYGYQFR